MNSQWYLITYDVRDDKRLRKCAQRLEGIGHRLQYSVFRCYLTPTQLQELRWELTQLLTPEDDVLFIPLCDRCVEGIQVTHSTEKNVDWPDRPPTFKIV